MGPNLGRGISAAYLYLKDSRSDFGKADMLYDLGRQPVTIPNTAFPWEFTVPLDGKVDRFAFMISGTTPDGKPPRSAQYVPSGKGRAP